jgi:hypothetical protein
MSGIRAKPKRRRDKIDPRSRIDFSRMYTVEHNVKVYDFGSVDKLYLERLLNQWLSVLLGGRTLLNYGSEYLSSIAETRLDDAGSIVTTASSRGSRNHPPRANKKKGKMKEIAHREPIIASSDSGVADVMNGSQSIISSQYSYDPGVEMGYT